MLKTLLKRKLLVLSFAKRVKKGEEPNAVAEEFKIDKFTIYKIVEVAGWGKFKLDEGKRSSSLLLIRTLFIEHSAFGTDVLFSGL